MKITFIYPDIFIGWQGKWTGQYYRGLASLSAVLKEAGHEVSLFHIYDLPEESFFLERIKEESPDLIGFSTTSHMFSLVKEMSAWIKQLDKDIPIICGGVHPTLDPENTIKDKSIDMLCVGEGEMVIVELCNALENKKDIKKISNIWVKEGDKVYSSPCRPLIEDLDSLPIPDTELFDYKNLTMESQGYANIMVSRGCPYNCTYCCNHALKKVYDKKSKYTRRCSVDKVIKEAEYIKNRYSFIKKIVFEDDILFVKKDWAKEFSQKYSSQIGIPFECNERVNYLDEEMAELLKKSGCYMVKFGLESGNEYIRSQVLGRKITQEIIKKAIILVKQKNIDVFTYNILGFPFETPKQIMETIKLNAEMDVDLLMHTVFYPYPGTVLYDICSDKGFLTGKESFSYFSNSTLKLDSVSPMQIALFQRYYDHIFRLYKHLYHKSSLRKMIWLFDIFFTSSLFQITSILFINPLHKIYQKFVKPLIT